MASESVNAPRLIDLFQAIASGDSWRSRKMLDAAPELARAALVTGATREDAATYLLEEIQHYVYAGDTALHVAAAAHGAELVQALLEFGGSPEARNRRGAQPLHYAADGTPGSRTWNPDAQAATVALLIRAGADPNAADKGGATPLHRAARTRCGAAVRALLEGGADPNLKNGSGSTSLHLAVLTTGRGGSGTPEAREQQGQIIRLLLQHGADPTVVGGTGKSAAVIAAKGRLQALLAR